MKNKFQCNLTRRRFNAGLVAAGVGISVAGLYDFNDDNEQSADGLLSLTENGKIYIHSGGGHLGLYAHENATGIVKDVLNSNAQHFVINYGKNPTQLPNLLAQHSNHLSFSSQKTNLKAAEILKEELKQEASVLLGGKAADYRIENGYAINAFSKISFAEIARQCSRRVVDADVSNKTYKLINELNVRGIIVAVGQAV